jgi:glycosyltransferase involved in cell wall biosynthesis
MRIGIFALTGDPQAGGGYTLETEILEALASMTEARVHDLFVYSLESSSQGEVARSALPTFRIPGPLRRMLSPRIRHVARRFMSTVPSKLVPSAFDGGERTWIHDGVRASKADLVVSLTPALFPGPDVPYLTSVWDLQSRLQPAFPEVSGGNEWERRHALYEKSLGRATRVIVGTVAGKREVERFYGVAEANIRVLPYPAPRLALDAGQRPNLVTAVDSPRSDRYLFYPAQYWPHKNHVAALRALRILLDRGFDFRIVFCGSDKGNKEWIRAEASRMGLSEQVRMDGFVTRDVLISLYKGAFALVFPSFFGPDNIPPLEAFAIGCPVIAAAVPGAEEQLGEAAILFDPRDPHAIAAAVMRLATEPGLRASLVEAGTVRARIRTPASFAKGLFNIIDELAPIRATWPPAAWSP